MRSIDTAMSALVDGVDMHSSVLLTLNGFHAMKKR
jgi:hypothetical protein